MPQTLFAQAGQYAPPSLWNDFDPTAAAQQRSYVPPVDSELPSYRGVAATNLRFPSQSVQASPFAAQRQSSYETPLSLTAPRAPHDAPSHSVMRRDDRATMIDGGLLDNVSAPSTEPIPDGEPLADQQLYGHPHSPLTYLDASPSHRESASAPWGGGSCGSGIAGDFVGGDYGPVGPPLFPWFGGGNFLFWSMANGTKQRLVLETGMPSTTLLSTRQVDPDNGIGYDLFFGRYFGCGKYAVSVNYLNFDPSAEWAVVTGLPPAYETAMPAFESIGYYDDHTDSASDFTSMKEVFDSLPNLAIDRDVSFQGVELNFWSFGFGGARRLTPADGTGLSSGLHNPLGHNGDCGPVCQPKHGYGGFGGPLERPCGGSSQLALLQGFRWFQFSDDFRFSAYDGINQSMFDSNVQNDLFGYQVGGRWNYCVSPRINVGIGAKFGAYVNNVEVMQRVGNSGMAARYESATPGSRRHVDQRDRGTVLAGLGEIDLGTGFRVNDCWTIRGGYRVLGISGVATSVGMIKHEMFSENLSARHEANDSVLLHGAYIGTEFNW